MSLSAPSTQAAPLEIRRNDPARKLRWGHDPVLTAVVAGQIGVSLVGMSSRAVWLDEAYSAVTARGSLSDIRSALMLDNGPLLHYWLLHMWRSLWGESALALRSLSLLFAIGTTVLIYGIAWALFEGKTTARVAATLWAVNPLAVHYANQIRMYTAYAFLGTAFLLCLMPRSPLSSRTRGGISAITLSALVYTHNGGWIAAAAAGLAALLVRPRTALNRWTLTGCAVAIASYIPWISVLASQLARGDRGLWWMELYWSPWNAMLSLAAFCPISRGARFTGLASLPGHWWMGVLALWMVPLIAAVLRPRAPSRAGVHFLALFLGLGLLLPTVVSMLGRPIYVPGRIDFVLLPTFLILVAFGLTRLARAFRWGGVAVLLGLSAWGILSWLRESPVRSEIAWTATLAREARPGDVVLCGPMTLPQAQYYLASRGLRFFSYPTQMMHEPALFNGYWYWRHVDLLSDAANAVHMAAQDLSPGNALWVVFPTAQVGYRRCLQQALLGQEHLTFDKDYTSSNMGLLRLDWEISLIRYAR